MNSTNLENFKWIPVQQNISRSSTATTTATTTTARKRHTKPPCSLCIVPGGFRSIKDPILRFLCAKGCSGGPLVVPQSTTSSITTTTTTKSTTKPTTTTTSTTIPTRTITSITSKTRETTLQHFIEDERVMLQRLPDNKQNVVSKTTYFLVLVGMMGFGAILCVVVLVRKYARTVKRNRVGSIADESM